MQTQSLTFSRLLRVAGSLVLLLSFCTVGQTADQRLDTAFQQAVNACGVEYLELERQLLNTNAQGMLESHLNDAGPIARLLAQGLLSAIKQPEPLEAIKYLDRQPERFKLTILGEPPSTGVGNALYNTYEGKAAEFIALRLLKEKPSPRWRVHSILVYLAKAKQPSTTAALIYFGAERPEKDFLEAVIIALKAIEDPELATKLKEARKAIEGSGGKWPGALNELLAESPPRSTLFPAIPLIADADPSIRHSVVTRVPSLMVVSRQGDILTVSFPNLHTTNLMVGQKMETGFMDEERIYINGEARFRGMSLGAFQPSTNGLTLGRDGLPPVGQEFVLEHDVTLFETDMPAQHMWSPQSGKHYKVLWTRTFRETIK